MVTNIKERANAWLVDDTDCYYSKSGCGQTAEIIRDLLAEVERLNNYLLMLDNTSEVCE